MAAATTTSNPLNNFIGAAGAAASVVKSVNSVETPPTSSLSSTSSSPSATAAPVPAATSAVAGAHHGLSEGAKIGIIVGCVVGGLLLLALLGLCCCCLLRRRRRSKRRPTVTPVEDEEVKSWKSPINPGRHHSNYSPAQRGQVPTEQSPTVPLMAAAAAEHHVHNEKAPSLSQHPAMRHCENPFVPEPSSSRRTAPNSRAGLTDGMIPGAAAYVLPEKTGSRKSSSRSRSNSDTRPQSSGLPTHNDADRPPTPFGLTGFGEPAGHTIHRDHGVSPPYSGIGQPYEHQHVHNLQVDAPSRELRQSLHNHEIFPGAAFADESHPKYRNSRGYTTPPEVPSRSPNRNNSASMLVDSSYDSELSTTTASNSSGERYQSQIDPYQPAQRETVAPWEQHQKRFANSPQSSPHVAAPPPIPWEESGSNIHSRKHQSHSPRQSGQYPSGDGRRRSSRSPATSINGQPRRLRFEDLQADNRASGGYSSVGQHDSYDGYNNNNSNNSNRWSQGVGEAL
ncbi:hypothetical protein HO173_011930 [Letharia columbiana]|uniref:receptor protein-tyrosine kinase n=1 Tax=Letharia columbiana TaxID=112416 RepID=A0A8H6CQR2_9LECA|nr:uncharacterized protein HO173_011930 [Letharia columbiana]KAF6227828.1 hypothetical protein HO173_011930 [Letharia columbiana]